MMLRQLPYFHAVVQKGSFTAVVDECFISQSAIITGNDFLCDGGASASYFYGPLTESRIMNTTSALISRSIILNFIFWIRYFCEAVRGDHFKQ